MKIYTAMPAGLKPFYRSELMQSATALLTGELQRSWTHLERAHILAQPYPVQHTAVHWKMLKFGVRIKNFKEVIGQIPRLLVGGVKSFVGKVPAGNTGGANVPPLTPMKIPEELASVIKSVTG